MKNHVLFTALYPLPITVLGIALNERMHTSWLGRSISITKCLLCLCQDMEYGLQTFTGSASAERSVQVVWHITMSSSNAQWLWDIMILNFISDLPSPHIYATVSVVQIIFSKIMCLMAETISSTTIHISHNNDIFQFHELSSYLISDSDVDKSQFYRPLYKIIHNLMSTEYFYWALGEYFYWEHYWSIHFTVRGFSNNSFYFPLWRISLS